MPRRKQQAPRRAAGTRAASLPSLPSLPCLPFPPRPLASPLASLRLFHNRLPAGSAAAPRSAAAPLPAAAEGSAEQLPGWRRSAGLGVLGGFYLFFFFRVGGA